MSTTAAWLPDISADCEAWGQPSSGDWVLAVPWRLEGLFPMESWAWRVRYALSPILQRRLGAELCAWAVTPWSPGITGWTIRSVLTSSRPNLCCIRCFRLGNTLPLQGWTFTPPTASWSVPLTIEAAGAPKSAAFLKTFSTQAGNTISALMLTMFRRVKIQPISLPEADQVRIVCCQIALGAKSNAFSGTTRSISSSWIVTVQLQNPAVSTSSPILFLWITTFSCSRHLSLYPPYWGTSWNRIFTAPLLLWSLTWSLGVSGGRCCSDSLSIAHYWEGGTKVPFCGTLLRVVKGGPWGGCSGTYGPSAVFAKLTIIHYFRWPVNGSPPVAFVPAFTPMIRMQIIATPEVL